MIHPRAICLLTAALTAVISLIVLLAVFKLNPFTALFFASPALALAAGMPFYPRSHV